MASGSDDYVTRAKRISERGHAGSYARGNAEEKAIVERAVVRDWACAMKQLHGTHVTEIASVDLDRPDCVAIVDGEEWSFEVTEFVNSALLEELITARRNGEDVSSSKGPYFHKAQWSFTAFQQLLSDRLNKKEDSFRNKNSHADVLIIHTAEPWLSPDDVERWLPESRFQHPTSFDRVDFLMDYRPGRHPRYPLYPVIPR